MIKKSKLDSTIKSVAEGNYIIIIQFMNDVDLAGLLIMILKGFDLTTK